MTNLRSLSIVVVVSFIAAAMIAPISTAGTVNMVLDPTDNSANLTINASSQLMVKTNATGGLSMMAFKLLEQSFNQNYSYNVTVVAGSTLNTVPNRFSVSTMLILLSPVTSLNRDYVSFNGCCGCIHSRSNDRTNINRRDSEYGSGPK